MSSSTHTIKKASPLGKKPTQRVLRAHSQRVLQLWVALQPCWTASAPLMHNAIGWLTVYVGLAPALLLVRIARRFGRTGAVTAVGLIAFAAAYAPRGLAAPWGLDQGGQYEHKFVVSAMLVVAYIAPQALLAIRWVRRWLRRSVRRVLNSVADAVAERMEP